jgi:FMN reductase (NADPH)
MDTISKNPVIEQIYQHASVRNFKSDPIPDELIKEIVAAGQRASTSSNMQTYSVVVTKDENQRLEMQVLCNHQKHISQAPVFLTWCADVSRLDRITQARGYPHASEYTEHFLIAAVDAAIAMQNAALAAESIGLGMCYIGAIRNYPLEVIKLLGLPKLVFPISGMTLGWPAGEAMIRPRLPLNAILHWEKYDTSQEDEALEVYDTAMIDTRIYRGRQVPVPGKVGEMEDYSWQEHSARRGSKPTRINLKSELQEQGFCLK